jgi:hypothetical protein
MKLIHHALSGFFFGHMVYLFMSKKSSIGLCHKKVNIHADSLANLSQKVILKKNKKNKFKALDSRKKSEFFSEQSCLNMSQNSHFAFLFENSRSDK